MRSLGDLEGSNRTIVGLKPKSTATLTSPTSTGSNRTIVGLKHGFIVAATSPFLCSNRTIVGLKLLADNDLTAQQNAAIAPLWD